MMMVKFIMNEIPKKDIYYQDKCVGKVLSYEYLGTETMGSYKITALILDTYYHKVLEKIQKRMDIFTNEKVSRHPHTEIFL